ncbi:MAG TPA: sterol desaturase family protein [Oscillatoriaceae cyanobacterium]
MTSLITQAVPFFFLLIGLETAYSLIFRKGLYRLDDAIASLSCGAGQQVLEVFYLGAMLLLYTAIYDHARVLSQPGQTPLTWAIAFLGVDFGYYWFHRASHRVGLLWGAHVTHHQSEEYNLTTALRQDAFESAFSYLFYLPLAVLGVPPLVFLVVRQMQMIYQFGVHTRAVGRLGPLEWLFTTPSHHRVHHGKNPRYLDKNFAGVFIVWDRLFGTFEPETETVVYGTVKPLASWNPVRANLSVWWGLVRDSVRMPGWGERLALWLKPPGWQPAALGGPLAVPEVDAENYAKYAPGAPGTLAAFATAQFVPAIAATVFLPTVGPGLAPKLALALLLVWTLVDVGGLFEGKAWALGAEFARLGAIALMAVLWPGLPMPVQIGVLCASAAMTVWLLMLRSRFSQGKPAAAPAP